jgi:hypothetical protein
MQAPSDIVLSLVPKFPLEETKHILALSKIWRMLVLASGVGVLAVLGTARCLEPAATGFGTHQQLGLPPCSSVALFGFRCPSCGMTTAWSLATRGDIVGAARVNAGGLLLAIIAMAYLPASCYFTWRGRSTRGGWFSLALGISILTSLAIAVAQWLWRLYF